MPKELVTTKAILESLYPHEVIILSGRNGSRTISRASDVFFGHIYSGFFDEGVDDPSERTPELRIAVYKVSQMPESPDDTSFEPILNALSGDIERFCLTGDQIIAFCEEHPERLDADNGTLFFRKNREKLLVVIVNKHCDGLHVVWEWYKVGCIMPKGYTLIGFRIVVPYPY